MLRQNRISTVPCEIATACAIWLCIISAQIPAELRGIQLLSCLDWASSCMMHACCTCLDWHQNYMVSLKVDHSSFVQDAVCLRCCHAVLLTEHWCRIADMVVAAVISMQDPLGSGPDEICSWIEVKGLQLTLQDMYCKSLCGTLLCDATADLHLMAACCNMSMTGITLIIPHRARTAQEGMYETTNFISVAMQ